MAARRPLPPYYFVGGPFEYTGGNSSTANIARQRYVGTRPERYFRERAGRQLDGLAPCELQELQKVLTDTLGKHVKRKMPPTLELVSSLPQNVSPFTQSTATERSEIGE